MESAEILITGGSGLLGTELRKLLPGALFPSSRAFDITSYDRMVMWYWLSVLSLGRSPIKAVLHAAAITSPLKCDQDPIKAMLTNVIGTTNMVRFCAKFGMKLHYISTDYVFGGDWGNYREEQPVYPVNKYAWSKLGGECAVRMYDNSLIVRTSFGPNVFPYNKAFIDQYTSREPVSVIATKIVALLSKNVTGIIHIGAPRRSVYQYAVSLDPSKDIERASIKDLPFRLPRDTSLDCSKYDGIMRETS
jgi:dTDP-4-dehydrorhamnose reductase